MKRAFVVLVTAIFLVIGHTSMGEAWLPRAHAEDLLAPLPDGVWIKGTTVSLDDTKQCWTKRSRPLLQVKRNGRYVTVARGRLTKTSCMKGYPYEASYTFDLRDGGGAEKLSLRSTDGTRNGSSYYLRTVYSSVSEYNNVVAQFLKAFDDAITGNAGGGSGAGTPTSGWSGCYYNGKPMWGKVKVINIGFADFTVKRTTMFPDLKVKPVSSFPTSCGEWQFIEYGIPDFTIKYTDLGFADFSIQLVDSFPGR